MVASNCLEVITNINKGAPVYGPILNEIKDRRKDKDVVSFRFEHRESNFEAHALAKAAASLAVGRHVFLGIVPDIICIPDTLMLK